MDRGASTSSLRRFAAAAAAASVVLAGLAATASAQKINEIHVGNGGGDRGFTEIEFTSTGPTSLAGKYLAIYDSGGAVLSTRELTPDITQHQSQRTALVANALDLNGVTVEYPVMAGPQPGAAGVCLTSGDPLAFPVIGLDCVSYGAVPPLEGGPSPVGTAAAALQPGQTLQRTHARGCATLLEEADDTNNSAADFSLVGTPTPRNNASAPIGTPCKPKCKKKGKRKKGKRGDASSAKGKKKKKKKCGGKKKRKKK